LAFKLRNNYGRFVSIANIINEGGISKGINLVIKQRKMKKEDKMRREQASKIYSSPISVISREEAIGRIGKQIEIGRNIKDQRIFSMTDLENAQERRTEWLEDNIKLFARVSNNFLFDEEYSMDPSFDLNSAITFTLKEKYFKDDINEQIGRLESFLARLKLTPEDKAEEPTGREPVEKPIRQGQPRETQPKEAQPRETITREVKSKEDPLIERPSIEKLMRKKVFKEILPKEKSLKEEPSKEVPDKIKLLAEEPPATPVLNQRQLPVSNILLFHGHDEAAKESALGFIEKLRHRAIIVHEQSDGSRNIIEKFRQFPKIDFAIFLFTAGDIALPPDKPREGQASFIQNLLFEFGYVVGKLGQERVCVLYKERTEIPMDCSGVVCIPMDPRGGWRLLVAREIKQAGIEIDLNKAV
jgi:predicted nucleotide-binding protein